MPSITMPQLGESVTEGTIGRWLKKPGDRIERDEPLVEVITDKVNAEIPSPVAGTLERINAAEGTVVAVGQEIAYVTVAGEARPEAVGVTSRSEAETVSDGDQETPRTSPLVRKLAREHNLDLRLIRGTGLGGRVTREDVEAYLQQYPVASTGGIVSPAPVSTATATSSAETEDQIPMTPMRRTIAQRMAQSVREIPHAWLMLEADVTGLVRLREESKERFRRTEGVELTYVPFVLKAAAESLREFPIVNSTWNDGRIILKREINLGVAVALEDGLVVPVIRNTDQKSF